MISKTTSLPLRSFILIYYLASVAKLCGLANFIEKFSCVSGILPLTSAQLVDFVHEVFRRYWLVQLITPKIGDFSAVAEIMLVEQKVSRVFRVFAHYCVGGVGHYRHVPHQMFEVFSRLACSRCRLELWFNKNLLSWIYRSYGNLINRDN